MQPTKIINVVIREKKTTFYYQLGGSNDVGLLIENHPKINLIQVRIFYQMKVLSPFRGSLLTLPC